MQLLVDRTHVKRIDKQTLQHHTTVCLLFLRRSIMNPSSCLLVLTCRLMWEGIQLPKWQSWQRTSMLVSHMLGQVMNEPPSSMHGTFASDICFPFWKLNWQTNRRFSMTQDVWEAVWMCSQQQEASNIHSQSVQEHRELGCWVRRSAKKQV